MFMLYIYICTKYSIKFELVKVHIVIFEGMWTNLYLICLAYKLNVKDILEAKSVLNVIVSNVLSSMTGSVAIYWLTQAKTLIKSHITIQTKFNKNQSYYTMLFYIF